MKASSLPLEAADWPANWCPLEHVMSLLDGRWTVLILRELFRDGHVRFRELQRRLDDLSPRTLTDRLRRLEEAGVIRRANSDEGALGYVLTERGAGMAPMFEAAIAWAAADRKALAVNRQEVFSRLGES